MTASTQDYLFSHAVRPNTRWYDRAVSLTFPPMEEERERAVFLRALGRTLEQVRKRLTPYGSQESIGLVLGVNRDTVGRWEQGKRDPKVYDLVQLWRRYRETEAR